VDVFADRRGQRRLSASGAALIAAATALLGGCNVEWVREHPLGCRLDEQRLVRETLYLGATIPGGGEVDAAAWRRFEDDVVTPAFPKGYTVVDAHGKWRGADGATSGEPSRLLIVVHPDDLAGADSVRSIARRYRETFHQEAVLAERTAVCATF
jgi:hypothetical protein